MRIVAVLPKYPPEARVGAFLATHELLADLATRGHTVVALQRLLKDGEYEFEGVRVGPGNDNTELNRHIRAADVVISHVGDDGITHHAAQRWKKPSVRIMHGHDPDARKKLAGARLVVFNSQHLAREVGWDGPYIVVHPPLRFHKAPCTGDRITLVNLSQEKGGELFWRLARKRPDLPFLAVKGGWGLQLVSRGPNVDVVGPTRLMREVYRRTRILLMPSEVESWGMVAFEAAQFGIPTVAHPTAGLLESMGPAASYADRDCEAAWLAQIDRLQDYGQWEDASHKARMRVTAFDSKVGLDRFAGAIEGITNGISETNGGSGTVREAGASEVGEGRSRGEEHLESEEEVAV